MFSGIVRDVGSFGSIRAEGAGRRVVIRTAFPFAGPDAVGLGDSIAVQGACLTVDRLVAPDGFEVVIGQETMARTTLGALADGARVNLERSLRLADRLDGHLVAGHVDGVGTVRSFVRSSESLVLWVDAPAELGRYVAVK